MHNNEHEMYGKAAAKVSFDQASLRGARRRSKKDQKGGGKKRVVNRELFTRTDTNTDPCHKTPD